MNRAIEIRPQAEADIEEAFRHYHDYSTDLGSGFIDDLDAVLSRIRENPAHYQSVHRDLHRVLLKRFPYAVFYSFTDQVVTVFAVLHQASDPQRWKRL
jgi:plasmid stabilization system protein ParE